MQGSKRDIDVKNRLLDYVGEDEGEMIWENSIKTCMLPYVKQITSVKFNAWSRALETGALGQPRGMGGEGGRRGVQDRGDRCTPVADSRWCMAKTTTIL